VVVVAMDGVGMASQGAASQPTMSLQLLQLDQPLGGAVTTHGPVESGHESVRGGRTASWQSEVTPVSRGSSAVRSLPDRRRAPSSDGDGSDCQAERRCLSLLLLFR